MTFQTHLTVLLALLLSCLKTCNLSLKVKSHLMDIKAHKTRTKRVNSMKLGLPWPNQQTNKVDFRVFILGDHDFVIDSCSWGPVGMGHRKNHLCGETLTWELKLMDEIYFYFSINNHSNSTDTFYKKKLLSAKESYL